tara:strand:- start:1163 stop:1447 length:285 start_codon:yes stop_codon:yes gene_type:complete
MQDSSYVDDENRRVPSAVELARFEESPDDANNEVASFASGELGLEESDAEFYLQRWLSYLEAKKENPDAIMALLLQFKEEELTAAEFHAVVTGL